MFPIITIIFLVIPVVEIYLLIHVGQMIGPLWTVLLVVLTAVIGVRLLKIQGLSTLMRAQQKLKTGELPANEMLEGLGLVVAGALLLTPGFFTDGVGFLLLLPPTRIWLVKLVAARFVLSGDIRAQQGAGQQQNPQKNIIDGVKYTKDD